MRNSPVTKGRRIQAGAIRSIQEIAFVLGFSLLTHTQALAAKGIQAHNTPQTNAVEKGSPMTTHARGTFDVNIIPQPPEDKAQDAIPGRMLIEKQFHGDLEANSKGQMLAAMTEVKGSAGYVAIEHVTGKLNGRAGSFVLQHFGTMARGVPQLNVIVVPDSGTGELVGLAGTMTIIIADGKHSYDFAYTLADAHP